VDWDFAVLVGGMLAEAAIILLLIRGRAFRTFPVFSFYLCWSLFSDSFLYYIRINNSYDSFVHIYEVQLVIDSVMIFAVLVELAWSVLRPVRNSLPKYSWIAVAVLIAIGALVLWPVAGLVAPHKLLPSGLTLFKLQQTPAILRAVFFLALAAFSQVLSIGWRDRELQIATGLGFYSIASLTITIAHTHQLATAPSYASLDRLAGLSYLAALLYWAYCFAKQPAERREFSPQMKSMLLAVAGAARTARIDLEDSTKSRR
jgi:hypothetical protein